MARGAQRAVSVIVVNWNGKHLLGECLSSLMEQTLRDFQVVLVDNGSTDGSTEWVASHFPSVNILSLPENRGFAGGNNVGIQAASGEYIALLNNDTRVDSLWLEALYDRICSDQRIAACDSKVLYYDQPDTIWSAGASYSIAGSVASRGQLEPDSPAYERPADVFVAVACAAIYRRAAFQRVGPFDHDFVAGYEDVDWSFRAHLCGYRVVNEPQSLVYHKVSATHRHNSVAFVYHGQRNVFATFVKNMPGSLLARYWPFHLAYTLGSLAYFAKVGRTSAFLRAKRDAAKDAVILRRKRAQVQQARTASSAEIDQLLSRDWVPGKIRKLRGRP